MTGAVGAGWHGPDTPRGGGIMKRMVWKTTSLTLGGLSLVAALVSSTYAAPLPVGACCSIVQGCCGGPSSTEGSGGTQKRGLLSCFETTEELCGLGNTYQGNSTTCAGECMVTTSTLPQGGACCLFEGGCSKTTAKECEVLGNFQGAETECGFVECPIPTTTTTLPPTGLCCLGFRDCAELTAKECDGSGGLYGGDGSTCEFAKCLGPTTTTTTTLVSSGACCLFGSGCNDLTAKECDEVGFYGGDGTECASIKCAVPSTTTTMLVTTTTTTEASICGDANSDGDVTALDALLVLKNAVGGGACVLARCDYNGDGDVTASDALAILKKSVGQPVPSMCPEP